MEDILNYTIPIIEQLATGNIALLGSKTMAQIHEREDITKAVLSFLQDSNDEALYFNRLNQLLDTLEYRRLLLYLPLADIKRAPHYFQETYLKAWYGLLSAQDARENFFEGDTFEVNARPGGEFERVVKCAHLTPWLVEAGYLDYSALKRILILNQDNDVLLRSFANTWRLIRDWKLLTNNELQTLEGLTARVAQRARLDPLYVSKGRKKWLRERSEQTSCGDLLTPKADLRGPFSPNMAAFRKELDSIQSSLGAEEVVLVGGSRLKGYGTKTSDLDLFKLQDLKNDPRMSAGSPHAAHIYLNMLWLGGEKVNNLARLALSYAEAYFGRPDRAMSLERIESDLLQYRLLHKGFGRHFGGNSSIVKSYPEMDGNCPFYDERYRKIATALFVKYVFIPT